MTVLTLWGLIPQHVPGDLQLTPLTARFNNWGSLVCIILAVACHLFAEYSDVRPPMDDEDPTLVSYLRFTATLALGGLIYESCLALCVYWMGLQTLYQTDMPFRRRLRLSRKLLFVFSFLTFTYVLMATDTQWVHKGWIAEYYGGYQVVYSIRYVEWVCCAPFVLSISGQLDHGPDGSPRNGLIPSSMCTGIYCIISWQGLVVKSWWWSFILITWAFVCYFTCCYEQLYFAFYIRDKGRAGKVRAGLIIYLVVMMGIYGVVYLLPIWGLCSAAFENKFYCIGDASFKLGTSIMLLATNDLANNEEMRRRAEAKAEELQTLVQTASVPVFCVDKDGRINEWNMKTAELTGLSQEKAMGLPLLPMLSENSQAAGHAMIQHALAGEETMTLETTLNPLAAEDLPLDDLGERMGLKKALLMLSCAPQKDKVGNVKGACFVGCDLTEVAAHREAEDRKVRFMAVVSHELRSPLHGIIGLIDHLCDTEKNERRLHFMKLVNTCAMRLLDLVVNIMEMASLVRVTVNDCARQRLSRDPADLSKIVEEILSLVKRSTDESGQPLLRPGVVLVNKVKGLPIIEADAHKCTQVLFKMVTNACKFTSSGRITLDCREDPAGSWVEVSVSDTGKGISSRSLAHIFQPFEQEENPAARGYHGLGLGLSIAHEVVKRHGGHIRVQSTVNVGTTFTVRLPVVMAESPACTETSSPPHTEQGVAHHSAELSESQLTSPAITSSAPTRGVILSVDDDCINQEILSGMLSEYELHVASDGVQAVEYLRTCTVLPDVMLLDVMMPGMSGFEVCRYVRIDMKIGMTALPILMLSASTEDASMIEAFDCGANAYMAKPFEKQVLTARIRSCINLKYEIPDVMLSRPVSPAACRSLQEMNEWTGRPVGASDMRMRRRPELSA